MRYSSDPRWVEARFDGKCGALGCDQAIRKGDRIFYYPSTRKALAVPCRHALDAEADFEAHRQYEEGY